MCGIYGKFSFQSHERVSEDLLDRLCRQIRHRGPDDQGMYVKDHIGLGIRRLSIIDVAGGHQPMHNEDKTVWVIFNGEVYNFQELRGDLERRGHFFLTNSDTEVIVHAYEVYGLNCLQRFRGMFAIGLWDEARQRLVLAQDRVGKKPLYYTVAGGALLFGSEIMSLLQDPSVARQVDLRALNLYLTFQYVPAPLTMFQGIWKVPPGSLLLCEKWAIRGLLERGDGLKRGHGHHSRTVAFSRENLLDRVRGRGIQRRDPKQIAPSTSPLADIVF